MRKRTKIIIGAVIVVALSGVAARYIFNWYHNQQHEEPGLTHNVVAEEKPYSNLIESEDSYMYHQFDDGTLAITGVNDISGDIDLPRAYQGAVVTHVAAGAFKGNANLQKVNISYPLLIDFYAFQNSSVTEIVIEDNNGLMPETPIGFSPYCFAECKQLENFYCDAYMPGMEPYMFAGCTSLKTVTFITPAVNIPEYTFKDCTSLTEIELPGTIKNIDENAFSGCESLQTVKGFNGSYVETWAKNNGYNWVGKDIMDT